MKNILVILLAAFLCGCAGSRCVVTARSVQQPVSCTPCVFDSSGKIRTVQSRDVVRHIRFSKYHWHMLWKSVPLNHAEWDISQEINAKFKETPGNALVNVTIRAQGCDFLHWYIAALAPIIPTYVKVTVEGDVAQIADRKP